MLIYYVDASNGNDNNNGLSESAAWATLARVNVTKLVPGDTVLFKRGEIWRETLLISNSGIPGKPITFGAYGVGINPLFGGADRVTGWTLHSGSIYRKVLTGWMNKPNQVFENGVRLAYKTSVGALTAGSYYYNSKLNTLYVRCTGNVNPTTRVIEASRRQYGIDFNGKSHITLRNIDTSHCNLNGFTWQTVAGGTNIYVSDCVSGWHGLRGFGMGGYTDLRLDAVTIVNCVAHDTLGEGFWAGNGRDIGLVKCVAYNCGNDKRDKGYQFGEGGGVVVGIRAVDCYVRECRIYDIGIRSGLLIEYEAGYARPLRTVIEQNFITTYTPGSIGGALSTQGDSSIIRNNVLHGNQPRNLIQSLNGSLNERFYHNTIWQKGAAWAVALTEAENTDLRNNIIVNHGNGALVYVGADGNSGFSADHNCYFGTRPFWYWEADDQYPGTIENWRTKSKQEINSVVSSPLLVDIDTLI